MSQLEVKQTDIAAPDSDTASVLDIDNLADLDQEEPGSGAEAVAATADSPSQSGSAIDANGVRYSLRHVNGLSTPTTGTSGVDTDTGTSVSVSARRRAAPSTAGGRAKLSGGPRKRARANTRGEVAQGVIQGSQASLKVIQDFYRLTWG